MSRRWHVWLRAEAVAKRSRERKIWTMSSVGSDGRGAGCMGGGRGRGDGSDGDGCVGRFEDCVVGGMLEVGVVSATRAVTRWW